MYTSKIYTIIFCGWASYTGLGAKPLQRAKVRFCTYKYEQFISFCPHLYRILQIYLDFIVNNLYNIVLNDEKSATVVAGIQLR